MFTWLQHCCHHNQLRHVQQYAAERANDHAAAGASETDLVLHAADLLASEVVRLPLRYGEAVVQFEKVGLTHAVSREEK